MQPRKYEDAKKKIFVAFSRFRGNKRRITEGPRSENRSD